MMINLEDLSAEELFALANQKKQQEIQAAKQLEIRQRMDDIRRRRELLVSEFEQQSQTLQKDMQALQQRQDELLRKHQSALDLIDSNLNELEHSLSDQASGKTAAEGNGSSGQKKKRDGTEALIEAILEILAKRKSISESMLKEQLRARNLSSSALGKALQQLIREGRVVDHGYGSYALGKKVGK